jgi:dipeptidyl-peptidase-4
MLRVLKIKRVWVIVLVLMIFHHARSQEVQRWWKDGNGYYQLEQHQIVSHPLPKGNTSIVVGTSDLAIPGESTPLVIANFTLSADEQKVLLFTHTERVWRLRTRGDYWVYDRSNKSMKQIGKSRPASSLMFAKLSPDGRRVAYVSDYNLYLEDLTTGDVKQLTTDGSRKFINGTFDWVYEEEFFCRDGFRWSPDSKTIAFWQIDARDTKDFYMINNTDSVYSKVIPVEYPKVGQKPSAARIGVVDIQTKEVRWMNIPGDARDHYLVRAEYIPGTSDLLVQQLNRKQNLSVLYRCQTTTGVVTPVYEERDAAWVDVHASSGEDHPNRVDFRYAFDWLSQNKEILWGSDEDGWRHLYRLSLDGKKKTLITTGAYDVIAVEGIDEKNGWVYFLASPENATQKYLYRVNLSGKGKEILVTPTSLRGTHDYAVGPSGRYAFHSFENAYTPPSSEWVALPQHTSLDASRSIAAQLGSIPEEKTTEFFKVKTADGIEMDGWMVKPTHFDGSKKYPVIFYVYSEPAGTTVTDTYGASQHFLYAGDIRQDGYIYISLDNRGTPAPKGRAWRKSIYRKIGQINIRDQAMAAKEILKWSFIDPERVAVWGWSGGGSATLNLMFQYPDIYKTGIAVAAVANQLTYDNIYQERYMGLPQENREDFLNGSPIRYAKNLRGNLLYIHGTGDDNVHYQNAEMLINELVKYNKQFQFMAYPNRTHGLSEGEGTFEHLATLYTKFLNTYCPPGGK